MANILRSDRLGNRIEIETASDDYGIVGFIRKGSARRMCDGSMQRPVILSVAGKSAEDAADRVIAEYNAFLTKRFGLGED